MTLATGTKLGPYEIISPAGAGGMGEVYRARDSRLNRDVAIKVLPAHLSSDLVFAQRLVREAQAVSSLNHPHICTLHDVGSQNSIYYLVMEYLEGETLADRLQKGALRLPQAFTIASELADALDKAHRQGVIHRDLKPGNIMLTRHGVKLMDFGLAKPVIGIEASAALGGTYTPSTPTISLAALSASASPVTEKGALVGTFQYMAPEVLQGQQASTSSDIFSFGCVLYEMLTGRRAFEGKSQLSVLAAILDHEPVPISSLQPGLPPQLEEIVRHCLAKNPDERYGCMRDVNIQLEIMAQPGMLGAREESSSELRRSRLSWFAAGLVISAVILATVILSRAPQNREAIQASILPPAGTTFVTLTTGSGPPVLSPDGTRLAFTARDAKGGLLIYVRPLSSIAAQPLAGTEDAMYPFWSPDNRDLGFFAAGKLKRISSDGGPPQVICDAASGRGGTWSKEGIIVFTPGVSNSLMRVPAAGGVPQPASKLDVSEGHNSHRWPYFLPDGKHFLFWARGSRNSQGNSVYVGILGSLDSKFLMKSDSLAVYASRHLLFMRAQTLMVQPFDPDRLELTGHPVPLAEHVLTNSGVNRPIFSVSDTGALVYQTGDAASGWNLVWFGRDGKQIGTLGQSQRYFFPTFSPRGNRLAAAIFDEQGNSDIWIFDLLRGTKTRLTFGPTVQLFPVWSPDERLIYYMSTKKGTPHIYVRNADGSGVERVVLESAAAAELPSSISPDGKYLVYEHLSSDRKNGRDIWALPLSGGAQPFPVVQTGFEDVEPAISPDGKWMAYENDESGRMEIYVTSFPAGGAKWQVSTEGGVEAKWRRDGKELFFLDSSDSIVAVDVSTSVNAVRLGTPHALFRPPALEGGAYDVTADGKKFLVSSGDVRGEHEPLTLVLDWTSHLKP